MLGLLYILLCWAIGNIISYLTGNYISGNIIGMVLMFMALYFRLISPEKVKPAAQFLLGSMALFFVPFGVGMMVAYDMVMNNIWALAVSVLISTVLVIVVVGRMFQRLNKKI